MLMRCCSCFHEVARRDGQVNEESRLGEAQKKMPTTDRYSRTQAHDAGEEEEKEKEQEQERSGFVML
jgi:hypothetical protein